MDFSGWPIYTRVDAPDLLIWKFCEALVAKRDSIPWSGGPGTEQGLPMERMVSEAVGTPIDLPFHPVAREFWIERDFSNSKAATCWSVGC